MKLLRVVFTITAHTRVLECRWLFLYFCLMHNYFTHMREKYRGQQVLFLGSGFDNRKNQPP